MRLVLEVPAVTTHCDHVKKIHAKTHCIYDHFWLPTYPIPLLSSQSAAVRRPPSVLVFCVDQSLLSHCLLWQCSQGFSYASPRAFHEKRCYCRRRIFFHVGIARAFFHVPRFIYKQEPWVGWEQSPWMNREWRSWAESKISPVQKKAVHIHTKKGPSQYSSGRQHGGCDGRRPARQWG